tara:strand:- start:40 stop:171 length:132 start_codon:yes stop_codon:yes gene_type:complete
MEGLPAVDREFDLPHVAKSPDLVPQQASRPHIDWSNCDHGVAQ